MAASDTPLSSKQGTFKHGPIHASTDGKCVIIEANDDEGDDAQVCADMAEARALRDWITTLLPADDALRTTRTCGGTGKVFVQYGEGPNWTEEREDCPGCKECTAVETPAVTDPSALPPDVCRRLLAMRQAFVEKDFDEAYHQLYQIACPPPPTTMMPESLTPWRKVEARAADEPSDGSGFGLAPCGCSLVPVHGAGCASLKTGESLDQPKR